MHRDLPPDQAPRPRASGLLQADRAGSRDRVISSMVSACLLAVMGTLVFAWALRMPDYPWLFAVGGLPWLAGVVVFGRALRRFTQER